MTLREFCEKHEIKNVPYVSEYSFGITKTGYGIDIFSGAFAIENGEIKSLDGDCYSMDHDYYKIELIVAEKDAHTFIGEAPIFKKGDKILHVVDECEFY